MIVRRSGPALVLCVALLAPGATARGQDEDTKGFEKIDLNVLRSAELSGFRGKKVWVDGKFAGLYTQPGATIHEVRLDKVAQRGRVLIMPQDDPGEQMVNALVQYKTPKPESKPLGEKRKNQPLSNVRVFGRVEVVDGEPVVQMEKIRKLQDDDDEFNGRLDALGKVAEDKQNPEDHFQVGREAYARAELYGVDLGAIVRRANAEGVKIEIRRRRPGDLKQAIVLAKRSIELAQNVDEGIKLLGEVVGDPKADAAEKEEATKLLKQHQAYFWRGVYISYGRFKASIGYLQRNNAWVRQERAEFDDVIKKELTEQKNVIVRTALNYREYMQKGKVYRGMNKEEVANTKGYGYPKFVDRRRVKDPRTGQNVLWDQWVYENGARVYFVNGECFDDRAAGTKWPET